jgi:hypothetical protein
LAPTTTDRLRRAARAVIGSTWFWGVLIGLCSYPDTVLTPGVGLDPSASAGIELANAMGINQGTDFAWTYGPLGFLESPSLVSGWLAPFAMIHFLALRIGLGLSLLWAVRRCIPLVPAVILAYAGCTATQTEVVPLALVTIWALVAVLPDPPPWSGRLLAIGGGAYAALEALIRLNVGAGVLLLVLIAVAAMPGPRGRNLATLAGTFIGVGGVLWFASGQGLGNIDDFIATSAQIVSGYSQAMGIEQAPTGWDGAFAGVVTVVALGLAVYATRGLSPLRRAGGVLIVLAAAFFAAKQAFVRHDGGHAGVFAGVGIAVFAALAPHGPRPAWRVGVVAVAVLVIAVAAAPIRGLSQGDIFRPGDALTLAVKQSYDVFNPSRRGQLADAAKQRLRDAYALDPAMLAKLRTGDVQIDPWEATMAWAYDLNWDPLPVFQEYAAYTADLDRRNAETLIAPDGPDFVLRKRTTPDNAVATVDFRYGPFDDPATLRTLLCDYRVIATDDEYQLLERGANRCGAARDLGSAEVQFNTPVAVPAARPDELVFVRVERDTPGRLRPFVYKDVQRTIKLDQTPYRFIGDPAENGILLTAPPKLDFPQPFAAAANPETIEFGRDAGIGAGPTTLHLEFYAVPVSR